MVAKTYKKRRNTMKMILVAVTAFSIMMSIFTLESEANRWMEKGCGSCVKGGLAVATDPYKKFQADTIDQRQELMTKRFEMQRENLKASPDKTKIDALQSEIKNIQSKIQYIRSLSNLPNDKNDGECYQPLGGCNKKNMGECAKNTAGCNGFPCGQK